MHRSPYLAALFFAAVAPALLAQAPAAEAKPELPNDLHWVRNSAEYRALVLQTYRVAGRRLGELAAGREPGTWAVALDADETVISNSQYQKELTESGASFSPESWGEWVGRRQAPALPGARDFLDRVHALGGRIAIVTNRREPLCPATADNFRARKLPFDVILCRAEESSKAPRWERVRQGTAREGLPALEIVMWLGDNIFDFPEMDQEKRSGPRAAFEKFGDVYFTFPNPTYGSWTSNPME